MDQQDWEAFGACFEKSGEFGSYARCGGSRGSVANDGVTRAQQTGNG